MAKKTTQFLWKTRQQKSNENSNFLEIALKVQFIFPPRKHAHLSCAESVLRHAFLPDSLFLLLRSSYEHFFWPAFATDVERAMLRKRICAWLLSAKLNSLMNSDILSEIITREFRHANSSVEDRRHLSRCPFSFFETKTYFRNFSTCDNEGFVSVLRRIFFFQNNPQKWVLAKLSIGI